MAILSVQAQPFSIAGSGVSAGATSITLSSFKTIDGVNLTLANFGTKGYLTADPNNGTQEEQFAFTGVVQNGNGTATLTGVVSVTFVSPYTETAGFAKSHPGGATVVISNTAGFHNTFANKDNNETITGAYTFTQTTTGVTPTLPAHLATKAYADALTFVGAPNATTTTKGIVELPLTAEVNAGTATGGTGAALSVTPNTLLASNYGLNVYERYTDYAVDTSLTDAYAVTLAPAPTALTAGLTFSFKPANTNIGPCSINPNGLGAVAIKKEGTLDVADGDIVAGGVYQLTHDGTNFQLINPKGSVPTGAIFDWSTNTSPTGYLLCDGTAVSRTTYAALFSVIGTTYGVGDGATTFNVPNAKGRVTVARDAAQTEFDVLGETGGAKTHTLVLGEIPAHTHTLGASVTGNSQAGNIGNGVNGTTDTGSSGGGGSHNNLQPYLVLNKIIKT